MLGRRTAQGNAGESPPVWLSIDQNTHERKPFVQGRNHHKAISKIIPKAHTALGIFPADERGDLTMPRVAT